MKFVSILAIMLVFSTLAASVAISGTVFNSTLKPVNGAVVELNFPRQVSVAVNGSYSFDVEPGNYVLTARKEIAGEELTASEDITIGAQNAKLDFILLLPSALDSGELSDYAGTLANTRDSTSEEGLNEPVPLWLFILGIIAILAIASAVYWKLREKPHVVEKEIAKKVEKTPAVEVPKVEMPKINAPQMQNKPEIKIEATAGKMNEFKLQILQLLEKKGGAAEQKELRKELPWSEARMSIELTELEKMGRIKKIKKGRANLVKII